MASLDEHEPKRERRRSRKPRRSGDGPAGTSGRPRPHGFEALEEALRALPAGSQATKELRDRAREMRLLLRIMTSRASSLDEALRSCIDAVCEVTGWPIGHAYVLSLNGKRMESSSIWRVDDPERTAALRERSAGARFSPGEGFIGRIWGSRQPASVSDVWKDLGFLRARLADLPVRGAFGFPVDVEGEIIAILEFFSYREIHREARPLEMVRALGEHVGRVFERNRAEAGRSQAAERLSLALEAGGLAAWDWDLDRDVTTWSDAHYRLLGYEPGDVVPSFEVWEERLHADDRQRVLDEIAKAREAGRPYQCEYRVIQPSGRTLWIDARGLFLFDATGVAHHMYGVMIDVTRRREAEDILREADRRKNAFIATLGHELRSPLAAIRSGVEALGPGDSTDAIREMLTRQTGNMARLLDDLLDLGRISRGAIHLEKQRVALAELVRGTVATVRGEIDARGHALEVRVEPEDAHLRGDPVRLEQILGNLLGNAIRYTEPGGRIRVEAVRAEDEARLTVTDTGAGFAASDAEVIFEPFYQATKGSGGLGLGLSLVRQLAVLHGGRVEAHSPGPGQGSAFIVTLPVGEEESDRPRAPGPEIRGPVDLGDALVLLVDDHRDSIESLSLLLSAHCRVETATDGAEAIRKARDLGPDAILLDLGLPDVSGLDVARALRSEPALARTPIVALTGFGDGESAAAVRAAGFDDHVLKPAGVADLLQLLQRLVRR